MTIAELALWPKRNQWGPKRSLELSKHLARYETIFPNVETCDLWAEITSRSYATGRVVAGADAWIAATAIQWGLPLVTTDYGDFHHIRGLTLVRV